MRIMSDQNNSEGSEDKKTKENLLTKGLKGWNNFVSGLKDGFENFQKSLEEQQKKNKEEWDKNKEKTSKFFKKIKDDWNNKMHQIKTDIEKKQLETKEQWDARKQKIKNDMGSWQEKVRQDWKDGVKEWNRMSAKAYLRFLLYIIPIIVILIIIIRLLGPVI